VKIAIEQPFFLPYLEYFSLIKHTDRFILFDTVQYTKAWVNRNRILKPGPGWQFIVVPLSKHSRATKINEIRINNSLDWQARIFRQLEHYKKRAPFYAPTVAVLKEALAIQTDSIVQLNSHVLQTICAYLDIDLDLDIFSELDLAIGEVRAPDEWALNICRALGDIEEFWEPALGLEFFDRDKYARASLGLKFLKLNFPRYRQRRPVFENGLSIIDVLMFNDPASVNEMLDDYEIL